MDDPGVRCHPIRLAHKRHCAFKAALKASSSQPSALAHMLGFFSHHSSHAHGHAKEQKEREEFTRVLVQDSEDVMGKVMATAHSEAKQVVASRLYGTDHMCSNIAVTGAERVYKTMCRVLESPGVMSELLV
ncbi:hypothetical protein HaLaN_31738 [Haematococcus lacustris]|uniref:Uncharacterized protein n=1 Tax=Haematococcus lacustris TaxID=44745 RepID=A0A6A0AID0_HAELA|nr:hypothetical protein HaLaN_31738 [Haematococcus lacustris]